MTAEDEKQAVSIVTTLSGQLMTAALGMIALEGAFLTFAVDKQVCGVLFWCTITTAFVSFILSIIRGGKGISQLYKTGAQGNWNFARGDRHFQWQTGLCCIGLVLFMLAVVGALKDKPSDSEVLQKQVVNIGLNLEKQTMLTQQLFNQWQSNQSNTALLAQMNQIKQQLDQLRKDVEQMKKTAPLPQNHRRPQ